MYVGVREEGGGYLLGLGEREGGGLCWRAGRVSVWCV